eukprot:GHVT01061675.1.p2 GENE.GHVT01061675.1~~GHVT01061675.1.p2  ORF type:complete len:106 (-),score=4.00 GHVT01061675.1:550-867(-)
MGSPMVRLDEGDSSQDLGTLAQAFVPHRCAHEENVAVYTDASEEGTGFAWQVQDRTALGLFFPARTQPSHRAVGLHREAYGLYTLATRTQGLWRNPMPVYTDALP